LHNKNRLKQYGNSLNKNSRKSETTDSENLAILNAQLCGDKLAEDVVIIDLSKIETAPADYFVVATVTSSSQMDAIADSILRTSKDYKLISPRIEGREALEWVLIDYFDVVIHIMTLEVRTRFKIEKLWGDGKFFAVNQEAEMNEISYDDVLEFYRATLD
jgi:ribosome-associated protein